MPLYCTVTPFLFQEEFSSSTSHKAYTNLTNQIAALPLTGKNISFDKGNFQNFKLKNLVKENCAPGTASATVFTHKRLILWNVLSGRIVTTTGERLCTAHCRLNIDVIF